ncbi:MAG: efflux RND transporter periplasmic adaptor subunit [Thermacetogeniaceae bacterium]
MKNKRLVYIGAAVLVLVFAAAWSLINGGTQVATTPVQRGNIVKTVEDAGYVQPATSYDIDAAQNARVIQVPVKVGDPVKRGETLLTMENLDLSVQISETDTQLSQAAASVPEAEAALASARLQLANSKDSFDRTNQLFEAGAASQSDLDKARLDMDTAQQTVAQQTANLESAQVQVSGLQQTLDKLQAEEDKLVVTSPVDGIILSLPVKEQQVVLPGTPLVSVAGSQSTGAGQLEIRADILSDDMADVRVGQTAAITAPVLGQNTLTGTVKQIYPQAEEEQSALGIVQRRVPVIITLPQPQQLKPGFEVRVAIQTDSRQNALLVPTESVRTTAAGQKEVMTVVKGRVHLQNVSIGIGDQKNYEVTKGLSDGDVVIRDGSQDLAENTRVKPAS